jgi:hypothetical protein
VWSDEVGDTANSTEKGLFAVALISLADNLIWKYMAPCFWQAILDFGEKIIANRALYGSKMLSSQTSPTNPTEPTARLVCLELRKLP